MAETTIEIIGVDSDDLSKEEKLEITRKLFDIVHEDIGKNPEDIALYD